MAVSQTSTTSAASRCLFFATHSGSPCEPFSSAPSIRIVTAQGNSAFIARCARQASTKVITWPLSSEAPRATICFLPAASTAIRGSKGGVSHRSSGSTGWTS